MKIVIDIPDVPIQDYRDLFHKIHGMAASEGLFDDKEKSQRALALKAVLDILDGIVNGTPLPKGHGRLIDADETLKSMDTWDKFGYTETGCFVRQPSNDYVPYVHYEDMVKAVSGTPTIIEADKKSEE